MHMRASVMVVYNKGAAAVNPSSSPGASGQRNTSKHLLSGRVELFTTRPRQRILAHCF